MTLAIALTSGLLFLHPGVDDVDWTRAESEFRSHVRPDRPTECGEAARSLARVADSRAALLLWKSIDQQIESLDSIGERRKKHEAALARIEGSGIQPRSVTGRKSTGSGEVDRRRDAIRTAVDEAERASTILEAYCDALGASLSGLEGTDWTKGFQPVTAAASGRTGPRLRAAAIRALGACRASEARDVLETLLVKEPDCTIRLQALAAIGARRDPESARAVIAALGDPSWFVRASAVATLVAIRSKLSIAPLIDALARETGRLQEDVEKALVALTGRNFHSNSTLWREWWEKDGPAFAVVGTPGATVDAAKASKADASTQSPTTTFYGIETRSLKVLFILDVSGSMAEPITRQASGPSASYKSKLVVAHEELRRALRALPTEATFNLLVYSSDVKRWGSSPMMRASTENKEAADAWMRSIPAKGSTGIHDALMAGFAIAGIGMSDAHYTSGADTIYFLTDGRATSGAITDVERLLADVHRKNQLSRVVIHCVGVGPDADNDFLSRLAAQNGGKHVKK